MAGYYVWPEYPKNASEKKIQLDVDGRCDLSRFCTVKKYSWDIALEDLEFSGCFKFWRLPYVSQC